MRKSPERPKRSCGAQRNSVQSGTIRLSQDKSVTFLKIVVPFPTLAGGMEEEEEALLAVVEDLCAELGYGEREPEPADVRSVLSGGRGAPLAGMLSPEQESWVAQMRGCLAKLAAAVGSGRRGGEPQRMVGVALDGAELVMRGELARGKTEALPGLMSSFVFLVALSMVERDEALALSQRAAELVEGGQRR